VLGCTRRDETSLGAPVHDLLMLERTPHAFIWTKTVDELFTKIGTLKTKNKRSYRALGWVAKSRA
jgi:hypothetical protein